MLALHQLMFNKLTKMATGEFRSLDKLTLGECEAKIKVRVIRIWRGATRVGVEFKNFNVLLLDNKVNRIFSSKSEIQDKYWDFQLNCLLAGKKGSCFHSNKVC